MLALVLEEPGANVGVFYALVIFTPGGCRGASAVPSICAVESKAHPRVVEEQWPAVLWFLGWCSAVGIYAVISALGVVLDLETWH